MTGREIFNPLIGCICSWDVPTPGEKLENAGAEYAKLRSARVIRAKLS